LPWGHVSSGCIYQGDGPNGRGYSEEDQPNFCFERGNCSFYSGCKALAEQLLDSAACCYIWRLRMPFSHHDGPRNYLSKLMRYERLLDVRNSLCHLDDFVEACIDCWQLRADYGTYNLTNPGSITTREVVEMIQHSGLVERDFAFFASEAEFMRTAARAPRSSCVLDTTKARLAGLKMPHVVDALQDALERWRWEGQPAILRLPQHAALQSRAA
jgi:UDP-glucose 4,6-dehydratase